MTKQPWEYAVEARKVPYARFETKLDGYEHWEHRFDGKNHRVYVHQLLAIALGTDPSDLFGGGYQIHHRNGIRWDNRPGNIEVISVADHARKHQAELHGGSPWRNEELLRLGYTLYRTGDLAKRWDCSTRTINDWMSRFGIPRTDNGGRNPKRA